MDQEDQLKNYAQLRKVHWQNVQAVFNAVDAILKLLDEETDPSRAKVLAITQDLIRGTKIKWDEEEAANG